MHKKEHSVQDDQFYIFLFFEGVANVYFVLIAPKTPFLVLAETVSTFLISQGTEECSD